MERAPLLLLLICFCLATHAAIQTSPNLVANPTCQNLPIAPYWTPGGTTTWACGYDSSSTPSYYYFNTGVLPAGTSTAYLSQYIDLYPYQDWISLGKGSLSVTYSYKTSGSDSVYISINQYDINGNYLGGNQFPLNSGGNWITDTKQYAAPSNVYRTLLQFSCTRASSSAAGVCGVQVRSISQTVSVQDTTDQYVAGLTDNLGSSFNALTGTLYFVQSSPGYLSTFKPVRSGVAYSLYSVQLKQSLGGMNLLTGTNASPQHILFDTFDFKTSSTGGTLKVRPFPNSGVSITPIGNVDNNAVDQASLQNMLWSTKTYIPWGLLQPGFIFGVRKTGKTSTFGDFDFAKVYVNYVVDATAGSVVISLTVTYYNLVGLSGYQVIGTGYNSPKDVKVTQNGKTAYITEFGGTVVKIDLTASSRDRAYGTLVAQSIQYPYQLALDESNSVGYTIENILGAKVWKFSLVQNTANTQVASNIGGGYSIVVDKLGQYAYVGTLGSVYEVNIATGTTTLVYNFGAVISYLTWSDEYQTGILAVVGAGQMYQINIGVSPATVLLITTISNLKSIAISSPGNLLLVTATTILRYAITDPNFNFLGPALLGIGFIPYSSIFNGLASTSASSSYVVTKAPFGGSLPLMINFDKARSLSATFYQVIFRGAIVADPFVGELYVATLEKFVSTTVYPTSQRFPVRVPGQIWLNPQFGYLLDTRSAPEGADSIIRVEFYASASSLTLLSYSEITIKVANTPPTAKIYGISHTNDTGQTVVFNACDTVTGNSDTFQVQVDAYDVNSYLLSWNVYAYWGNNKNALVASDTYTAGHSSLALWYGVALGNGDGLVPPSTPWVATDPQDITSRKCAHTFILNVYGRATNGYSYIHWSTWSYSLSFYLN